MNVKFTFHFVNEPNVKKAKNFELADKIRDELAELGVEIKDGRDKTTWNLKS